jgi:hypothetical protein
MNHPVIQSATYQDRQFQWHPSEVVPQCGAANMPVRDVLALEAKLGSGPNRRVPKPGPKMAHGF